MITHGSEAKANQAAISRQSLGNVLRKTTPGQRQPCAAPIALGSLGKAKLNTSQHYGPIDRGENRSEGSMRSAMPLVDTSSNAPNPSVVRGTSD